jgi:hypothetical protein
MARKKEKKTGILNLMQKATTGAARQLAAGGGGGGGGAHVLRGELRSRQRDQRGWGTAPRGAAAGEGEEAACGG